VSIAGDAWRFRTLVEREAHVRFAKMAESLRREGFGDALADRAARASDDEKRHAQLCLDLAAELGSPVPDGGWEAAPLSPTSFDARDALVYEAAAQCCVAETESMATLSVLMDAMEPSRFRDAVVTIARDEVEHARIGWAVLGKERETRSLSFLEPYLAAMIDTGGAPLFLDPPRGEDESLVSFGVLLHLDKRRVFVEALAEVIVPGFARLGVATAAIERWLVSRGVTL
jgi:hypothetical protein